MNTGFRALFHLSCDKFVGSTDWLSTATEMVKFRAKIFIVRKFGPTPETNFLQRSYVRYCGSECWCWTSTFNSVYTAYICSLFFFSCSRFSLVIRSLPVFSLLARTISHFNVASKIATRLCRVYNRRKKLSLLLRLVTTKLPANLSTAGQTNVRQICRERQMKWHPYTLQ